MKILIMSILLSSCSTTGFYFVQSEHVNTILVNECKTTRYAHSENPDQSYTKQNCIQYFMTPMQITAWNDIQKGLQSRGQSTGLQVDLDK